MHRLVFKNACGYIDSNTVLPCPSCKSENLRLKEGDLVQQETNCSKSARKHPDWDPDWVKFTFSGFLRCSACEAAVQVIGDGAVGCGSELDEDGYPLHPYEEIFSPIYFHPSLPFFSSPKNSPQTVDDELKNSFKLFFCDPSAAANHLRAAIECLLTHLKVPRFTTTKKRRRFLSLHSRIEKIPQKYAKNKDFLLALKWIGNHGSHSETVSHDDILDGYELMEHFLNEAFENRTDYFQKMAKSINKRRGPRNK